MKIYTTYFAHLKKIDANIVPISIARYNPKGYIGKTYSYLSPTASILFDFKQDSDEKRYKERYYTDILNRLKLDRVLNDLNIIGNGKDIALVCYEKSESFCHRHIVAEWLNNNGIECEELV